MPFLKSLIGILISLLFVHNNQAQSPKVVTLIIGLSTVDNSKFETKYQKQYSGEATAGVPNDILSISNIAELNSHIKIILRDEHASKSNILETLDSIGKIVNEGDYFIFYFTGHGDLIKDNNNDETSGFDQTLVAFDDYLFDDEIYKVFVRVFYKTFNIMIIDACHSSTSYKFLSLNNKFNKIQSNYIYNTRSIFNDKSVFYDLCSYESIEIQLREPISLIYLGATLDEELAWGDSNGGLLTFYLNQIYSNATGFGNWNQYNYRRLACELYDKMILHNQILQYHELGSKVHLFNKNIPFKTF
jgi:hypothetical protein